MTIGIAARGSPFEITALLDPEGIRLRAPDRGGT